MTYRSKREDGQSLEVALTERMFRRMSDSRVSSTGLDDELTFDRITESAVRENNLGVRLRFRTPLRGDHALSVGADADRARFIKERVQRDAPLTGTTPVNLDERFRARSFRRNLCTGRIRACEGRRSLRGWAIAKPSPEPVLPRTRELVRVAARPIGKAQPS